MAKTRFACIMPDMPVRYVSAAAELYARVLGFKMVHLHDEEFAVMVRDGCRVGLSRKPAGAPVGTARRYAFVPSGLDECPRRSPTPGAKVLEVLKRRPYGMKDFLMQDPDGNHLAFGGYL